VARPREDLVTRPTLGAAVCALTLTSIIAACGPGAPARPDGTPPPSPQLSAQAAVRLKHLRFSSDKEKQRWERAILSVWKTPLGEMYDEYLFSPTEDHADLPLWARMLTERIFREIHFLNVRLGAIQVMTDDLYVSERMTADVNDRVTILTGHIDQERIRLEQTANTSTLFNASVSLLPALPLGSSYVREHLVAQAKEELRKWRGKPFDPTLSRGAFTAQPNHFSLYQVFNYWTVSYVILTSLEWFYGEWYYTSFFAPKDEVLLLSLDDLVTSMDLTEPKTRFPLWSNRRRLARP
jgi:hypothetical protein